MGSSKSLEARDVYSNSCHGTQSGDPSLLSKLNDIVHSLITLTHVTKLVGWTANISEPDSLVERKDPNKEIATIMFCILM